MTNKDSISISIIIPVSKDIRIFRCIDSIDINVEVIVILNGEYDKFIEKKLENTPRIKLYKLKEFNFSKIYNLGIEKASHENIFFMDSDCIFKKGTLMKIYSGLNHYSIVRAKVSFAYNNFIQRLIAKAREFTTSDPPNLYIPGPMFKKEVFKTVGPFIESINFASDAEMATRIKNARIEWLYIPDAEIIHDPLTTKQDLSSAFRYGYGRSQKYRALNTSRSISFIGELYYYFIKGAKSKGILVGFYLLLWCFCFTSGYIAEKIIYKTNK